MFTHPLAICAIACLAALELGVSVNAGLKNESVEEYANGLGQQAIGRLYLKSLQDDFNR